MGFIDLETMIKIRDKLLSKMPVVDDELSLISENPVQNKVITSALNEKIPYIGANQDINLDKHNIIINSKYNQNYGIIFGEDNTSRYKIYFEDGNFKFSFTNSTRLAVGTSGQYSTNYISSTYSSKSYLFRFPNDAGGTFATREYVNSTSLLLPSTPPSEENLVGINTSKQQTAITIGTGLSLNNNVLINTAPALNKVLYKHVITGIGKRQESSAPTATYTLYLTTTIGTSLSFSQINDLFWEGNIYGSFIITYQQEGSSSISKKIISGGVDIISSELVVWQAGDSALSYFHLQTITLDDINPV